MTPEAVLVWTQNNPLEPIHVDCATTVKLKILDGKCKMNPLEKIVMGYLYDAVKQCQGKLFDDALHQFIAHAELKLDDDMKMQVYEKRLMAETMLSRPVMKSFKAMIRQKGLLPPKLATADDE